MPRSHFLHLLTIHNTVPFLVRSDMGGMHVCPYLVTTGYPRRLEA